ncbi:YjgN family protein [Tropicibacter sp. S64]|uniref:YjgN family protein n=1 Tax=Tropicibacter sp. S64 TaxID=3415122 RepID=UPI003C7AACAF
MTDASSADPKSGPLLATTFHGTRSNLFGLAFRTGLLTVLTLGVYRFWMKTRLRRWYWSAIRVGGLPLEYVGDPMEKLLGFLVAVVILAFYIGIVNLALMFASFSLFQNNTAAYLLSFVGVIPIWFYAQYRARRYVLARTRWLGLRFGLEPGAWGYAVRALGYWLLTILSCGLLWPLMTFRLEEYKTNRTFFGDKRLHQGGRWTMLYKPLVYIVLSAGLGVIGIIMSQLLGMAEGGFVATAAVLLGLFGLAYYKVDSLRRLTNAKTLGGVSLRLTASPWRVLWIHGFGYTLAGLAAAVPLGLLTLLFLQLQSLETLVRLGAEDAPVLFEGADRWVFVVLSIMAYFSIFLVWSALTHALVTLPLVRHYAQGLTLSGSEHLSTIRQRPRDEHSEAEGFAEALDVGASL